MARHLHLRGYVAGDGFIYIAVPTPFCVLPCREIQVKGKGSLTTYWLLGNNQPLPMIKLEDVPAPNAKHQPKALSLDDHDGIKPSSQVQDSAGLSVPSAARRLGSKSLNHARRNSSFIRRLLGRTRSNSEPPDQPSTSNTASPSGAIVGVHATLWEDRQESIASTLPQTDSRANASLESYQSEATPAPFIKMTENYSATRQDAAAPYNSASTASLLATEMWTMSPILPQRHVSIDVDEVTHTPPDMSNLQASDDWGSSWRGIKGSTICW